jgi:uncharacterized damage-inducible protein DinB
MSCPICEKNHPYTLDQALAVLASSGRRLERLIQRLGPKRASARPAPGKWSPKEIVSHLADCELVYGVRYRTIVAEPGSVLIPFDQEAWAKNLRYREQPLKSAVAAFKTLRENNLALLRTIPKPAWKKSGRHQSYGPLTLRQLIVHITEHDRNHVAQIERLL